MNIDVKNKRVLTRVDFNVPLNDRFEITDDTRIRSALPTIEYILKNNGSVILMSHLGRPQKKLKPDGSLDKEKFTLEHLVDHLSNLLNRRVKFAGETTGKETERLARELQPGEVLLLENTRFHPGETSGSDDFAKELAGLADVYINDAFGSAHRAHASTTTVSKYFPKGARSFGFLMESEIEHANRVLHNPKRPLVAVIGGAKVSDKILLLEKLFDLADKIIIGGGMAYTFIRAQGGRTGASLVEEDRVELASQLLRKAKEKNVQILLPEDSVVADAFSPEASRKTVPSEMIENGWMGLDIGPRAQEAFRKALLGAKTILWNGPMGVFEMAPFAGGTEAVGKSVAEATTKGAFSLVGGGDSVAAINKLKIHDQVSYVSTGGGAMLEYLEGKSLPGIAAILDDD